ncbi:MAG: two-component sensor histidine kinase [Planctomycetes bacterium]|nr:two-component sensor histidine kinase [Planctomycetota bacterium]
MNAVLSRWELAAENIAVKIRWFGILFGYLLVNLGDPGEHQAILNAILALGVGYALVDTAYSLRRRIFLRGSPLLISLMEALFIALLCYYHQGLESPFRYYYILSLICCAIRHPPRVTYLTWALHSLSLLTLFGFLPPDERRPSALILPLVVIGWVTWASLSLATLLKRVGERLSTVNRELKEHRAQLEARIAERTRELQEAQAHVLHQEKMAAFGLLAAGIAHEVGNPLTSISSLIQMLQRRDQDLYTREKLTLVSGQLDRIQTTLRELVNFSRPASTARSRVAIVEVVQEALNIAKYYKRTKSRQIVTDIAPDLPAVLGVRDQLVQVMLNLILNAIDATDTGGRIFVGAEVVDQRLVIQVEDDGVGITPEHQPRLFQPYFTTKKHGTGLGLFVTRKLIHDHGGDIDVASKPGEGARFRVQLPAPAGFETHLPVAPCVEPRREKEDVAATVDKSTISR